MLLRKIPDKPRYGRTLRIAQNFIIQENINKLPIDPFVIAINNKWGVEKSGDIAKDLNFTREYVLNKFVKSKDGSAFYCFETTEYKIVYNESVSSLGRKRWTIIHEIGHIILKHFEDFNQTQITRGGLSEEEYKVLEQEADFFASQVLAPPIILKSLNVSSVVRLRTICGLSKQASENRYNNFINWLKRGKTATPLEKGILKPFHDFIHKKKCAICGYSFILEDAKNCPICGKKRIYWGEGKMLYEDGFELDEHGRATICPKCGNEETNFDGDHCIICGSYFVNKCAVTDNDYNGFSQNCDTLAPGNARYCYKCGNETTFFQAGILKAWDDKTKELQIAVSLDTDIPF